MNTASLHPTPDPDLVKLPCKRTLSRPINLSTINVRGLCDLLKQKMFLQHCEFLSLDIIGLSELHFKTTAPTRSIEFQNDLTYCSYWAPDPTSTASGVGILIRKDLKNHIHSTECFMGRLLMANFFFKQKTKLRIIQVYMPASNENLTVVLKNKIKEWIDDASHNGYIIFVMGDFNVNIDSYNSKVSNNRSTTGKAF